MDLQHKFGTAERFMRYVQIDTQSDPQSKTNPSTGKQKNLSSVLVSELLAIGLGDAHMDANGYIYATIPSNSKKQVPVICFCSHVDTAPDCSGTNVKPILHSDYNGEDIVLPDDKSQVISISKYGYLKEHIGKDIITASGTTLLGADDKAGVAIIMSMATYLLQHPETIHGDIKMVFTPDEEVGRGTDKIDLQKINAVAAYTLDGGECGMLEDETFSADSVKLTIQGISAHPGYAKDTLMNALKIAGELLSALPKNEWSPETTDHKQGFVHPVSMTGLAEQATIEFIIRDFEDDKLLEHEARLKTITENILKNYPGCSFEFEVKEQYRNMKKILDQHPQIVANAEEAYRRCEIPISKKPIRGGTDGSRLSYMGLPCPNLFTGMQAIHSKHEWIGVSDMEQSTAMLVELVQVWEQRAH